MTDSENKLDNATVRRFAKLLKNNGGSSNGSTGITTGTVIQNDNQLYVAVDDETLVPVSDTASNVNVGDKVTLAIDNEEALIVGNNSDASPTASELSETDTKATFAKVDASEAKDTAQTAQTTADNAQVTANTAQETAKGAEKVATNFIDIDDNNGITVGDMTAGTLGKNTYINSEGFYIRDGKDTLASFEDSDIRLGIESNKGTISFGRYGSSSPLVMDYERKEHFSISASDPIFSLHSDFSSTLDDKTYRNIPSIKMTDDGSGTASILLENSYFEKGDTTATLASYVGLTHGGIDIDGMDGNDMRVFLPSEFKDSVNCSSSLTVKGTSVSLEGHTHKASDISGADGFALKDHKHTTADLTDIDTLAKTGHTHTKSDITDFSHTHTKSEISDFGHDHIGEILKPDTIDASTITEGGRPVSLEGHTHTQSDITDFAHTHVKDDITDFSHTHTKSEITDFAHDHAGDALTPATINTTSTIKQNGTQVSLEGHTHEANDLATSTPIFKLQTVTTAYTAKASAYSSVKITLPTVSGYTPFCIKSNITNSQYVGIMAHYLSGNALNLAIRNFSSSAISNDISTIMIYIKAGWV